MQRVTCDVQRVTYPRARSFGRDGKQLEERRCSCGAGGQRRLQCKILIDGCVRAFVRVRLVGVLQVGVGGVVVRDV